MIEIISGTDRPGSMSLKIAQWLAEEYQRLGEAVDILDLCQLHLADAHGGQYYQGARGTFAEAGARIVKADGVVLVVPEYNGSFPGILKLFIDYWRYPEAFENRPMALIGLGARWGGLRPVEHLQQVFGYRNAYVFPNRVFLTHIKNIYKDGQITDPEIEKLLKVQSREFSQFIQALKSARLDANSRLSP